MKTLAMILGILLIPSFAMARGGAQTQKPLPQVKQIPADWLQNSGKTFTVKHGAGLAAVAAKLGNVTLPRQLNKIDGRRIQVNSVSKSQLLKNTFKVETTVREPNNFKWYQTFTVKKIQSSKKGDTYRILSNADGV